MGYNRKQGFTIFELVVTIVIIGLLAGIGSYLLILLVRNTIYIPIQMNVELVASEAMDIMIDGDHLAKGLRFCKDIRAANTNVVTFTNQDDVRIRYRYQGNQDRIQRRIIDGPNAGGWVTIPNYAAGVSILLTGDRLFYYYDANENQTTSANNVRRVEMEFIAQTGTGNFDDMEGQTQLKSSVVLKKFE